MRNFLKLMKSEGIKIQHTTLFWIHLILPLVGAAIFLWYYSFASWDSMNKIQADTSATAKAIASCSCADE